MSKLLFYSNTKLKNNIELKKIGVNIRLLNQNESEVLINRYKNILLNKKYKELSKKYQDIRENKDNYNRTEIENTYLSLIELEKKDRFKYDVIFNLYLDILNNKYQKLNLSFIRKYIKNIIVIDIDDIEFEKQFEHKYINILIPKLIDFSNYLSTRDGEINEFDSFLFDYDILENINNKYHMKVLGVLLNEIEKNNSIELNNLNKIRIMLNDNDKNFNFNFLMLIDNMFEDEGLIENQIVNKVSFIERILIGKDSNKQEGFILKVGILCNNLFQLDNSIIKEQLKEIYNIRSLIVHGNSEIIINNIEKYKTIFGENLKKGKNKYETKLNILVVVDTILEIYFMEILRQYLENYKLCEYMKCN